MTGKNTFEDCESNMQVNILTDTFFDIMSNFIPNKIILIDTRDSPWIKKKIKVLIHDENLVYKNHFKKNNSDTQRAFSQIQTQHQLSIENLKLKHYQKLSNKLSNDIFKGKCYWSILKDFLNSKRIPYIPLLIHQQICHRLSFKE